MASSWIKVEVITPDKPEIFQIAEILSIDPDAVLGKLVRIWTWADQQTIDGNAGSVTKGVLDRLAFITGFADALLTVGWLAYDDGKLVLPNFERHNGESSKKRALTNRRVAEHRKRETRNVTQPALQKELPEEEEEEDIKTPLSAREEIQIPPVIVPGIGEPIGKFNMHENWQPSDDFVMRARQWGHALPPDGYKKTDLAEFVTYWMAEGNVMQHVQWEQKFARLLMNRKGRAAGKRGNGSDDEEVPHWNSPEGWKDFL
ncbi:hypothetical protein DI17_003913 [Escherichia coli]|nr:hypothetical protein [Escherichia coli]